MPPKQVYHRWKLYAFIIFFIVRLPNQLDAKACTTIDQCSCEFDDGSGTMDLSNLGKQTDAPL